MFSSGRILFALLFFFTSSEAFAAKCYVKEYRDLGTTTSGSTPIAREPPEVEQAPIDFTAGAAPTSPFGATTSYIRVWCDAQASIKIGLNAVATNANSPLSAGSVEYFGVTKGHRLSAVANP